MFKTFPEFTKLTLKDRGEYEAFTKDFPPISDLTFVYLMTMWSALDTTRVAQLNGNLVISYWMPGDEEHSGLSLIGTNNIDESLCVLFDYLRDSGHEAKLVNIPQLVVDNIRYPDFFDFVLKSGDEDFVVSFKQHSSLPHLPFYQRSRIKKFVKHTGNLEVKDLDLTSRKNRQLLVDCTNRWPRKGLNNIGKFEDDSCRACLAHAHNLELRCLCLYDDGELIAYNLYSILPQPKRILIAHSRLDYSIPGISDYMTYSFSRWWLDQGIELGIIHGDMGLLRVRALQVALRPVELYRKYTIRPAG